MSQPPQRPLAPRPVLVTPNVMAGSAGEGSAQKPPPVHPRVRPQLSPTSGYGRPGANLSPGFVAGRPAAAHLQPYRGAYSQSQDLSGMAPRSAQNLTMPAPSRTPQPTRTGPPPRPQLTATGSHSTLPPNIIQYTNTAATPQGPANLPEAHASYDFRPKQKPFHPQQQQQQQQRGFFQPPWLAMKRGLGFGSGPGTQGQGETTPVPFMPPWVGGGGGGGHQVRPPQHQYQQLMHQHQQVTGRGTLPAMMPQQLQKKQGGGGIAMPGNMGRGVDGGMGMDGGILPDRSYLPPAPYPQRPPVMVRDQHHVLPAAGVIYTNSSEPDLQAPYDSRGATFYPTPNVGAIIPEEGGEQDDTNMTNGGLVTPLSNLVAHQQQQQQNGGGTTTTGGPSKPPQGGFARIPRAHSTIRQEINALQINQDSSTQAVLKGEATRDIRIKKKQHQKGKTRSAGISPELREHMGNFMRGEKGAKPDVGVGEGEEGIEEEGDGEGGGKGSVSSGVGVLLPERPTQPPPPLYEDEDYEEGQMRSESEYYPHQLSESDQLEQSRSVRVRSVAGPQMSAAAADGAGASSSEPSSSAASAADAVITGDRQEGVPFSAVPREVMPTIAQCLSSSSYAGMIALSRFDKALRNDIAPILLPLLLRVLGVLLPTLGFGSFLVCIIPQLPLPAALSHGCCIAYLIQQLTRRLFMLERGGNWRRWRPHLEMLYILRGRRPVVLGDEHFDAFGSRAAFVGRTEAVRQWKILSRGITVADDLGRQRLLMDHDGILCPPTGRSRPTLLASPSPLFPNAFDPASPPTQMEAFVTYPTYACMVAFELFYWLRYGEHIRWIKSWRSCRPSFAAFQHVCQLLAISASDVAQVGGWPRGVAVFDKERPDGAAVRHDRLVVVGSEVMGEGHMAVIRVEDWGSRRDVDICTTEAAPYDKTRRVVMDNLGEHLGGKMWAEEIEL
ncbi:unnamed protein product [Vitrella brassicaformis CCMP3155]|uniref:Uncharacterized protein n=1 Tax=Vitrella brassicaformis (strain CCMP3155) TaxID=1169540 RepID=A0A0G4F5K6_VITBC|nr:unnamed protein product [Vitrella brassicaformis CCMP3155]|eukprot:CEM07770.1 unnamed protein product [Vitrella brassicaformis CCMP3155]